ITQLKATAPDTPGLSLLEADYLTSVGKSDDVLTLLEKANRADPKNADLWVARANALNRRRQPDLVLDVLRQATATLGDLAVFRIARSNVLAGQGHEQGARAALADGLERLPKAQQGPLYQALGDLCLRQKDLPGARKAYTAWAQLEPDAPQPKLAMLNL